MLVIGHSLFLTFRWQLGFSVTNGNLGVLSLRGILTSFTVSSPELGCVSEHVDLRKESKKEDKMNLKTSWWQLEVCARNWEMASLKSSY